MADITSTPGSPLTAYDAGRRIGTRSSLRVQDEAEDRLLDVLERIQQQLAKMNEDENLVPGGRHYE